VEIGLRMRTEIERPPGDVYRFIAVEHGRNHPRWDTRTLQFSQLTPGPVAVGTRFAYRRRVLPSLTQKLELVVTELEPDRKFAFCMEGSMRARASYTLQPGSRPAATVVQAVGDFEVPGPQFLAPLMRAIVKRGVKQSQRRIKQLVEAGAPAR
jgi:Polyketide cyclase / dehydrase and lipid transport